jgi:L-aminopeptidase/D-esterase-like protein
MVDMEDSYKDREMGKDEQKSRKSDADARRFFNAITDVPGIEVGHCTDIDNLTGTTVILTRNGAVAGVDVRGAAPGTRETDAIHPINLIEKVHAVVLAGGSAYGLAAADGVMSYLEGQGIGFPLGDGHVVPIVPAAALFDLGRGGTAFSGRPVVAFGLRACEQAKTGAIAQGNVGAGTGALTGTLIGNELKGGIGTASVDLGNGAIVGALVAVNAGGSPINPATGEFYAAFLETDNEFGGLKKTSSLSSRGDKGQRVTRKTDAITHTTIAVAATNVVLTKVQATKVAQMAHDGMARAIRPVHTMFDGDAIFALSTGEKAIGDLGEVGQWGDMAARINTIGSAAADTLARAIIHAMLAAETVAGMQSYRDKYGS